MPNHLCPYQLPANKSHHTEPYSLQINEDTLAIIYKAHWKKLYYICYNKLEDKDMAMDMVHDLFKSLWERRNDLIINDSIEKYLLRAVKFQISTYFRVKVQQERNLGESMRYQNDTDTVTEKQVAFSFLKKELNDLVEQLPERCRLIYRLSRESGLNNRQIASSLLLSEKTVENQITKALSFIRHHLAAYKN